MLEWDRRGGASETDSLLSRPGMPLKAGLFSEMEIGGDGDACERCSTGLPGLGVMMLSASDAFWPGLLSGRKELRFLPVVSWVTTLVSDTSSPVTPVGPPGGPMRDQGQAFSELLELPPENLPLGRKTGWRYACSKIDRHWGLRSEVACQRIDS